MKGLILVDTRCLKTNNEIGSLFKDSVILIIQSHWDLWNGNKMMTWMMEGSEGMG